MDEGTVSDVSTNLSGIHLLNAFQKIRRKTQGILVHETLNSYMELQTVSGRPATSTAEIDAATSRVSLQYP